VDFSPFAALFDPLNVVATLSGAFLAGMVAGAVATVLAAAASRGR